MTSSFALLVVSICVTVLACLAAALVQYARGRHRSALQWVILAIILFLSLTFLADGGTP